MASSPATEARRGSHNRQDQTIKIEMEHIPMEERVPLIRESLPEIEVFGPHKSDREMRKFVRFRKGDHLVRCAHTQ